MVVLGQEQDQRGGGYSPQESFVGQLAQVNVWDEVLPYDQVLHTFNRCDRYVGSLVGWPDFKKGIKGQVVVSTRLSVRSSDKWRMTSQISIESKW